MKKLTEQLENFLELGGIKKDIIFLIFSAIALLISILDPLPLPFDLAWIAIILCGLPIILEAFIGLITRFDIKADLLVSLALIASICIGENFAAGEVAFIMQLGSLLEDLTVAKAKAGIEKLIHLTPQTARVIRSGKQEIISATEVAIGEILQVLPGETIPVDGIILSGQTSINQAVMTGESLPVDKTVGDKVSSGTINQFGVFEMQATKVGENSSIQRMIQLVQSADAGKAKIVGMADKWATWIVAIALTAATLTWMISGDIIRAVTILVVFCPCSLVLATPTAIMAAMGNATKHGFLIREGDALERLATVKKIAFDKTGTLTYGTPAVIAVRTLSENYTQNQLYDLTAAAEQFSEHPLGKAIVNCYKKDHQKPILHAYNFQLLPGLGISAVVGDKTILAGSKKLLMEQGIATTPKKEMKTFIHQGCTIIYIAINKEVAGYIALSDTVRTESENLIDILSEIGTPAVLLTGDNEHAAHTIANHLHIYETKANCLPEDKLNYIIQSQNNHTNICMIGDGINDAPALKMATVGIAMGGIGSDIAVDAADITLINDNVKELPHLVSLSQRMMHTIKRNLTFSMTLNVLAIILAIIGILNPIIGALVHNSGSVLVIINSALLLKWKNKKIYK